MLSLINKLTEGIFDENQMSSEHFVEMAEKEYLEKFWENAHTQKKS